MSYRQCWLVLIAAGFVLATLGWRSLSNGQQPAPKAAKGQADPGRFEFEVVQSFDAKYQGDTPGHMGKSGGLANRRPQVALGDAVFRGEEKIGVVTGLAWSRTNSSLEVEFDPVGEARVCVGDEVWLPLNGRKP